MYHRRRLAGAVLALLTACSGAACLPKAKEAGALTEPFRDDFNRAQLGERYKKTGGTWSLVNGALHSSGERNIPLWLDVPLSKNVRVEFTAWSNSPQVDTKLEIFGDGLRHESGYIVILGGWNNRITTIARLDEHEKTREEKRRGWEQGKRYRWTVERTNGRDVAFFIDGELVLTYRDEEPLVGPKHNRLGFSNWESEVYYDDLVITPLLD
jgi:hypothetical protein